MRKWKKIEKICLDVLYPPRCPVCGHVLLERGQMTCPECTEVFHPVTDGYCLKCGKPVREEEEYCKDCRTRKRSFDRGRSVFIYNTQMKQSLLRYKYYGSREYGNYYAAEIVRYVGWEIRKWSIDVIVPVPLSKRRYKSRGFNQAEDLAVKVGRQMGIPSACRLVTKVRDTKAQKTLDASQRRQNLQNAFHVSEPVNGLKVLLIDDVYTTGSTVEALADCLKENGASEVFFVTLCTGMQ